MYTQNSRYITPAPLLVVQSMKRNISKGEFTETNDEVIVQGSIQLSQIDMHNTITYFERYAIYCHPTETQLGIIECRFKKQC